MPGTGPARSNERLLTIGLLVPNDEAVGSTDRAGIEELVAGRLRPDSAFAEGCASPAALGDCGEDRPPVA
jgi:hypothetical protein